jgi:hypothetical protein
MSTRALFAWMVGSAAVLGGACGGTAGGPHYNLLTGSDAEGGIFAGDAGLPGPLDASIEENHLKVELITLSCPGECAEVEAVATGGHPPYTFAWEDGSTHPIREVCPTSNASYRVEVTDTGATGELSRPSETAQASLTADVLACPDGGTADSGPSGGVCLSNPSFEGTAAPTIEQIDAPPWMSCLLGLSYANIWSAGQADGIAASDGTTYLRLGTLGGEPRISSASEPLCAPMHAGTVYQVTVDMAYEPQDSTAPSSLQIWGATSSCSLGALLWSSPPVTGTTWTTFCATLSPTQETTYLTLGASVPSSVTGNTSGLYVDHMVPVAACP